MAFEPEPTPKHIQALEKREIVKVAAGNHHIMAVDSDGIPYTWGNGKRQIWKSSANDDTESLTGNYGRLGHAVQQDEWRPRPIEGFLGRVRLDHKKLIVSMSDQRDPHCW